MYICASVAMIFFVFDFGTWVCSDGVGFNYLFIYLFICLNIISDKQTAFITIQKVFLSSRLYHNLL